MFLLQKIRLVWLPRWNVNILYRYNSNKNNKSYFSFQQGVRGRCFCCSLRTVIEIKEKCVKFKWNEWISFHSNRTSNLHICIFIPQYHYFPCELQNVLSSYLIHPQIHFVGCFTGEIKFLSLHFQSFIYICGKLILC